jgi:TolB protein
MRARRVVALLVAALLATTLGVAQPAVVQATDPGAPGRIVFAREGLSETQIWTINPDGTDARQLTTEGWSNTQPSWSPDGSKIVFVSNRGPGPRVWAMDADGSNQVPLTDDVLYAMGPVWSPDGTKIAFARYVDNYDIWVMDADGTDQVNVTQDPAEDLWPSWRPGTTTLAFQSNRDGNSEIYAIDAGGGGLANLTNTPAVGEYEPDWSPDGTRLVFNAGSNIAVMNADGSARTTVTTTHQASHAAWSPDGSRIVFSSWRDLNNYELFVMNANGTAQLEITNLGYAGGPIDGATWPAWQPLAVAFVPPTVAFGNVAVGQPAAGRTITIKAGTQALSVTGVTIEGSGAAQFDLLSQTCTAAVVPALGSCTATVRFDPTVLGAASASLTLTGPDPVGTRALPLTGTGKTNLWSSQRAAAPKYTWATGSALARTVSGSTTYLHSLYATDRIGSRWASDSGARVGVYYVRSKNLGGTWTTPKRLNPTTQHAGRSAVAASGAYVYAAWVSVTKWVKYSPTAPRVLYFRRNTSHGTSTAWKSTLRLTSSTGRVDYPAIAASGSYVYVAYTDSATGSVKLKVSADRGVHWKTVTVGSTTRSGSSGRAGWPAVAAYGANVAVSWLGDIAGTLRARVSTTRGASWAATATMGASGSTPSVAASGSRVAVAWTDPAVKVRTWTAGAWADPITLPGTDGVAAEEPYGPVPALTGANGLAVTYSSCTFNCDGAEDDVSPRASLIWRSSLDGGATWAPSDVLGSSGSSAQRINDMPTILWPSPTRPFVVWNGWSAGTLSYRQYLRVGV